ncbi:MAG: Maf family protein [Eubacteriales bacterium]|nr:Maf family protein [Eubacteriales bacterium]
MHAQEKKLILASASPRRHELLAEMGVPYTILVTDADETVIGRPEERVRILAERKARAAAEGLQEGLVLGADTLVALDERSLGKPEDEQDARFMIMSLSGRTHQVYTGVCLYDAATKTAAVGCARSDVTFRRLSRADVDAYMASGEWEGKAGSYAIQGIGAGLVEKYEGSLSNIIGLPVELVEKMLREAGWAL